jgi:hypothetical protein
MTHTPGPWKILTADDGFIGDVEKRDFGITAGGIIAEVFYQIDDDVFADVEANANLIHAAPDLLEACEKAYGTIESLIAKVPQYKLEEANAYGVSNLLDEIIRKARGE